MKKIVFSFDDGRADTYSEAIPILLKYNLTATINITSDFVEKGNSYECFASGNNEPMSIDQIKDAQKKGFEIASHGHTHKNDIEDILENISVFKKWGLKNEFYGFASPNSKVTEADSELIMSILTNNIRYIRSGQQVRRKGFLFSAFYFLQEKTHSKFLFYKLNKKLISSFNNELRLFKGISITKNTTYKQLVYFINKMKDDSFSIFIFHSILGKNNEGYGKDKWYWDREKFEKLCKFLSEDKEILVVTNMELMENEHL